MDQEQKENENLFFNGYKETLFQNIISFFNKKAFVNVTLLCDGGSIRAHQVILAACSPFFENALMACSEPNPTLVFTDVSKNEMMLLLEYVYKGQISVAKNLVPSLLKIAKKLQIRGLVQNVDNSEKNFEDVIQDDNVRQSSSQVLMGTLEQNAEVPVENQNNSFVCTDLSNHEVTRWFSAKYSLGIQGHDDKVPNPLAKELSDSDSTQLDFNPATSQCSCRNFSTMKISTLIDTDSDVEFIDDFEVVATSNTQNKRSIEVRARVPKFMYRNRSRNKENLEEDVNQLKKNYRMRTRSGDTNQSKKIGNEDSSLLKTKKKGLKQNKKKVTQSKKNFVDDHYDKKNDEASTIEVNSLALRNKNIRKENEEKGISQLKKIHGMRIKCPLKTKKKGLTQNEKEATKSTMSEDSSLPHTSKEIRDQERKKKLQELLDDYL